MMKGKTKQYPWQASNDAIVLAVRSTSQMERRKMDEKNNSACRRELLKENI